MSEERKDRGGAGNGPADDKDQGTSPGGIEAKVRRRARKEKDEHPAAGPKSNGKIDSRFIQDCLYAKELGWGELFAAINRGRFVYNSTAKEWMEWKGHHWGFDELDAHKGAVETVVERLREEVSHLREQAKWAKEKGEGDRAGKFLDQVDFIFSTINKLREQKGRNACIEWARTCGNPLAVIGKKFDMQPWLLACSNGVVDLETGKFRDGRPDEMLSVACPTPWQGLDAPLGNWEDWLLEILNGDRETMEFLQRVLGYGITGRSDEHIFVVLWGPNGRNGKGTLVETLNYVLGALAGPVQSELLLDQGHSRSAAAPSPDILALKGMRLAFASETDEGRRFSVGRVKWLTGGDTLIGRGINEKRPTRFTPTHLLILMTNNKPHAPADDYAFWERLFLIQFPLSFVDRDPVAPYERRRRVGVAEEFKQYAPGILAWLVRGCLEYQKQGLNPPESIVKAKRQYQREEDLLADFLEDCCEIKEFAEVNAREIYDKFAEWFEKNVSKRVIKQKVFGTLMGRRFERGKRAGYPYYKGVCLKEDQGQAMF